ncbi:SDR family oxidoreductase [Nocardioides albidus]|uniref:SDR family oxidoreductase n=1 Tax=Nocardioides albidus TaxID=1517589 RepID=A0A5C4VKR7_9ACTN|nr:SDR family oxidoreductase [Nocardioides albidus]TNM36367.1 SDR family oxidoreductase [Nocardioides albidus]
MDVRDRVAVVTGSAGGIGAALAEELLRRGARVALGDLPGPRLDATRDRLAGEYGDRVIAVPGDASSRDDLAALLGAAREAHGDVDLFFANAGVPGAPELGDDEHWQRALDVNVLAHVRAAQLVVPEWLERGEGYFVSTASAAGLLTQIGSATYSVSKHAAVAFAEWLAVTYGARGIKVSCLCPMGVDTDMLNLGRTSEDAVERTMAQAVTDAGDVLTPAAVAGIVLDAVAEERFLVLPHPQVHRMLQGKAADHDRWIAGMHRYAASLGLDD